MEEAYKVGVTLALNGNVAKIVEGLIGQFESLDEAIKQTNGALTGLVAGMRLLRKEAEGTASALKGAAAAMERANRAAARNGAPGARNGSSGARAGREPGTGFSLTGSAFTPFGWDGPSRSPPLRLPYSGSSLTPSPRLLSGPRSGVSPYTYSGEVLPPVNSGGLPAVRQGPTIEGYAINPPGLPAPGSNAIVPTGRAYTWGSRQYGPWGNPRGSYGSWAWQFGPNGAPNWYTNYNNYGNGPIPMGPPGAGRGGVPPIPPYPGGPTYGFGGPPGPPRPPGSPPAPPPAPFGQPRGGSGGHGSFHSAAANLALPAIMGGEFLTKSFEAGAEFESWQHILAAKGFSPDQVQQVSKLAFDIQRTVKPTTVTGNMRLASEIMQTVQNPDEALKLLPEFAKLQTQFGAAGDAAGAEEMLAAIKAGEYRGVLTGKKDANGNMEIDTEKLKGFVNNLLVTDATFGIGPSAILQFMRSAGYAGAIVSDTSLFARQIALMQALGPGGAGTALRGFTQQFGSGRMSKAASQMLIEMDILHNGVGPDGKPFVRPNGPFNVMIDPRAYPPGLKNAVSEHPDQVITQYLFPKIETYLGKILGKQYTEASEHDKGIMELQYSGQLASTQTGSKELAETIRVKGLMDRDEEAYERQLKAQVGEKLTTDNPKITAEGLASSWNAFQTALGVAAMKPAVEMLDALTAELNKLAAWAQNNPDGGRKAMEGLAYGVGLFATGSAAAIGLAVLTNPASGLIVVAGGIEALGKGLTSLPAWLVNGIAGAASGARVAGATGAAVGFAVGAGLTPPPDHKLSPDEQRFDQQHPLSKKLDDLFFGPQSPSAPVAAPPASGTPNTPMVVHIGNMDEAVHGFASGMAHRLDTPPTGTLGYDSKQDFGGYYVGIGQ
jgi:hypothetical protein